MGTLHIIGGKKDMTPYDTAFENNKYCDFKVLADTMRSGGHDNYYIKEITGVDFGTKREKSFRPSFLSDLPRDECGILTRDEREMRADKQDMDDLKYFDVR